MDDPHATLDLRFRRIPSSTLAHRLKKTPDRRVVRESCVAWRTSGSVEMFLVDTARRIKVRCQAEPLVTTVNGFREPPQGETHVEQHRKRGRRASAPAKPTVRCAIYTRRSTEDGLQHSELLTRPAGVRIPPAPIAITRDQGVSGSTLPPQL